MLPESYTKHKISNTDSPRHSNSSSVSDSTGVKSGEAGGSSGSVSVEPAAVVVVVVRVLEKWYGWKGDWLQDWRWGGCVQGNNGGGGGGGILYTDEYIMLWWSEVVMEIMKERGGGRGGDGNVWWMWTWLCGFRHHWIFPYTSFSGSGHNISYFVKNAYI